MRRTENSYGVCHSGKTGPLKCNKGFTVRARLTQARHWCGESLALVADQIPVEECEDKIGSVFAKEDPDTWVYGVYPGSIGGGKYYCRNLKITSVGFGKLSQDDPITITYNKVKRTVQFKSSKFDLYQENLPEGVDFCLACCFYYNAAEIELEILEWE